MENRHKTVVGISGSGKTWMIQNRLIAALPLTEAVIAFSDCDSWEGLGYSIVGKIEDAELEIAEGETRILYRPDSISPDDLMAEYDALCELAVSVGDMTLVNDEIADICTPRYIPPYLFRLMRTGRRLGVQHIAASQRLNEVHNSVLSQSRDLYLFRMNRKDAVLCERYVYPVTADHLAELPPFSYYHVRDNQVEKHTPASSEKMEAD